MKKFLATILSAVLILSLGTGSFAAMTSAEKKAYQMYIAATEKLNKADSVVMDMDMAMAMTIDGQAIDYSVLATIAQVLEDGIPTEMYMYMEMPGLTGLTETAATTTEMYYTDGFAYMETEGQKIKMEMPIDDFLAQASVTSPTAVNFTADMISDITYDAQGNDRMVSFSVDMVKLMEASSELMDQFASGTVVEGMSGIEYGDMVISAVMDNKNNFKSLNMIFDMIIAAEGIEVSAAYDISMDIVQVGGVEIEFPEDLDQYEDYTAYLEEALGALEVEEDAAVEEDAEATEDDAAIEEDAEATEDDAAVDEDVEATENDAAADEDAEAAEEDAPAEEDAE